INRGNSGGPTFDIYGRVIGVNSAILSPSGGSVGIGFAIPASTAKPITDRLMRGETIERGYLGVQIGPIDREWVQSLGLESRDGAYVVSVTPGGPAARGGLQQGDVVLTLNGEKVRDGNDLTRRVGQARPGDNLRLEVWRDGRRQTLNVRSGTRPSAAELNAEGAEAPGAEPTPGGAAAGATVGGLTVAPISPTLRQRYEIPANVNGVVITQSGTGDNRAYQPGFVIMRAGQRAVTSVADFQAAVQAARSAGTGVFILVWTPQGNVPTVLELPKSE
ncbi:MAG: PDZ domain-containing protein, partial [Brevundimonas sp.]|nr:PDZ domain-containing protein [Brevundimonas sp.]